MLKKIVNFRRGSQPPHFQPQFDLIAIGTSYGGLAALKGVLSALPPNFPVPIAIVQHLSPYIPTHLADILSRHTVLSTQIVQHEVIPQRGVVYIAPPDKHLVVSSNHSLCLSDAPKEGFSRPAINPLLISAA